MGELYVKQGDSWVPVVRSGSLAGPPGPAGPAGPAGPPGQPGPYSANPNGYCTLAPGVVMLWGRYTVPSNAAAAQSDGWVSDTGSWVNAYRIINFQPVFSTIPWSVTASIQIPTSPTSWQSYDTFAQIWSLSANNMRVVLQSSSGVTQPVFNSIVHWKAIGPG